MPLVEIKFFEDEFTEDDRVNLITAVTDTMVRFTGESIRPHTWVVLQEVKSGNWGIGGNALGLADVRALQAETPDPPDPRDGVE
jgi:4-oxalocrotonate tautomerase